MYAVIATGGQQFRVSEGDTIVVKKLDAEVGSSQREQPDGLVQQALQGTAEVGSSLRGRLGARQTTCPKCDGLIAMRLSEQNVIRWGQRSELGPPGARMRE